ncbi:MAG: alpha/beta hydrolase [Cytophagales bacterium]|nr:alpha/beta hydrolase [Armatimonadota bacterium]
MSISESTSETAASSGGPVLILHGWGGNKPAHWQEHLFASLTGAGVPVQYPKLPDPAAPDRKAWLAALDVALEPLAGEANRLTVVAHSLGAISWFHLAAGAGRRLADRVLLVAPPYVMVGVPPTDAPPGVEAFFPPPLDASAIARAARETVIVASDNDDYATFEQTKAYADRLQIPIHLLGGAGHISPYWGYGEWPWVRDWCLGKAELPPQPKPDATS